MSPSVTLAAPAALPGPPMVSPADQIATLFVSHFDFIWRSLRRLGVAPGEVDDAAQEVFLVATRRLIDIQPGKERSFLFGTAMRVASDARRARVRRKESGDDTVLDNTAATELGPDELLDRKRARARLDEVLADMNLDLRSVFVLFELEELTMAEIATCLDIPPGTVASRLRRAREFFRMRSQSLQAKKVRHG